MLTPEKAEKLEFCREDADDIIIFASRIISTIKLIQMYKEDGFLPTRITGCIKDIRQWTDSLEKNFKRFLEPPMV